MGIVDSLRYYWRSSVAVLLAAAVTTAVLGGALIVGDSMRGSLRGLTLERLGAIDQAVVSEQFFRQELAEEIASSQGFEERFGRAAAAILMQGSIRHADNERRASRVSVQGIDDTFAELFPGDSANLALDRLEGQAFPSVVLNQSLASELNAEVGDSVVLALERPSDIPRDSLMGNTDPSDVVRTLRLAVRAVLPDRGAGRFSLSPHQTMPLVAFVPIRDLARALEQRSRANAIFVSSVPEIREQIEGGGKAGLAQAESQSAALKRGLEQAVALEDLGIEAVAVPVADADLESEAEVLQLTSRELVLRPELQSAIEAFAAEQRSTLLQVSTYLANRAFLQASAGEPDPGPLGESADRYTPYSTVAGLAVTSDGAQSGATAVADFGALDLIDGQQAPLPQPGEVLIQEWVADDLGATVGDFLTLVYYEVGDREELLTRSATFTIRGVLAMSGLAIDAALTPEFPGVNDADNMADWDPTFPVDLGTIRDKDELYWDDYGAAPKFLLNLDDARRLFGSRFGDTNTLRLLPASGTSVAELMENVTADLPRRTELLEAGITVQPLKRQGLQAARGATDFGMLFFGFSLFLIVSSALLVGLFFRLGVEQRASELGLRLAAGTSVSRVRRVFLTEGLFLAVLGALLGLAGAVAYAALMLTALETLWIGAVGSSFLELHVGRFTLPLAFVLSILVVLFAIWRAVRRLATLSVVSLLRGSTSARGAAVGKAKPPVSRRIAVVALVLAVVFFLASTLVDQAQAPMLFFGVGAALLVFGLALFSGWLGAPHQSVSGDDMKALSSPARMALANAETSAGRTLLSVALVAAASFVIVAVGSYGLSFGEEVRERYSGAGGFPLIAHADVSIHHDLNEDDGRFELGFSDQDSELLARAEIMPLRSVPGDDVSCLNLFQPETPGLLGVPPELIERGGFTFTRTLEVASDQEPGASTGEDNPWSLLESDLGPGVIPAFGDNNSVLWILKSGLGKDVEMVNEAGEPVRLRLVGLLRKSLFQSDLLISEQALLEHFPSRSGYQAFLIDTPVADETAVVDSLESNLERYGFDVQSTAQLLQSYQAVENTYLSTFQTLGGLGLLLGTLGLAVILLRNVIERRAELATLRALGFRRRRLGWLVVLENTLALVAGVGIGALAALVAVSPHLLESNASVPWLSLAFTLLLVMAVGTLASIAAVRAALRTPLLPALRSQ